MKTFWKLVGLTWPLKGWVLLATGLGFLTVASGVGLMTTSAYLISSAALHPSIAALSLAIVGVRFFGIARGLSRYLERYVSHYVTFRLLANLRVWFYRAVEPLAPARLLNYHSGDLLARVVGDIETLQNFYGRVLAPPLVAALVGGLVWVLLGAFNTGLALTMLVFYLLAGVGVPLLVYVLSHKLGRDVIASRTALNVQIIDSVQGLADLIAFGQAERQRARMESLNQKMIRSQARLAWVNALQTALGSWLISLMTWTMLLVAIPLVQAGQLNSLYLALLLLAAVAGFEAVLPLPGATQQLGSSLKAAEQLFEIVQTEPSVREPEVPAPRPASFNLQITNLSYSYGPDEPLVLDQLSLTLPPGKCLALVGPSGAGKSTLAYLLQRFYDYEKGSIQLGDRELKQYSQAEIAPMIAVVSQNTHLFNTTIRENLLLARPNASHTEIVEATKKAGLHDFIESLPQGYDTSIGEQGLRLSGGERQRLAIARALLKNAPILILDEPTAHLDSLAEQQILGLLPELTRQGRTTLLITHRLHGLEVADQIAVLDKGQVVEQGNLHDLLQREGLFWHLWKVQHEVLLEEAAF